MRFLIENFFRNTSLEEFNRLVEQEQMGGMGKVVRRVVPALQEFDEAGDKGLWDIQQFIEKELGLSYLGSGTQRVVFDIDGDHVLKLALNNDGIKANNKEANMNVQGLLRDLVPRVYMSDVNSKWIIMDRLEHEDDEDQWFEDVFGVSVNSDIVMWFANFLYNAIQDGRSISQAIEKAVERLEEKYGKKITPEIKSDLLEAPVLNKLLRAVDEFGSDFARVIGDMYYKNMGRDPEGRPVIIDWG